MRKTILCYCPVTLLLILAFSQTIRSLHADQGIPRLIKLSELHNKIRGGWAGQMIGGAYGAPLRFKYNGRIVDQQISWSPEDIYRGLNQETLYVDVAFNQVLVNYGLKASQARFADALASSRFPLWHSTMVARENLLRGIKAPQSGNPRFNIHADDIDFQSESDFIGLITPGLPKVSNEICDRVGHVLNYGDGVYGGMFVAAMYGEAFFERSTREIVTKALKVLPSESQYSRLIRDILIWHRQSPTNWRRTWERVELKWNHKDCFCPQGVLNNYNIDAKLNGAYLVIGLLYGRGDFSQTIEISARCGQDSVANTSSAGGILGTLMGYEQIPDRWKQNLSSATQQRLQFSQSNLNDVIENSFELAKKAIMESGGSITATDAFVPYQKHREAKVEQWLPPGQPLALRDETSWSWQGDWKESQESAIFKFGNLSKRTSSPGAEVICKFDGSGAVLAGSWETLGARAKVYLDNKLRREIDTSLFSSADAESRTNESLWHDFHLKPGPHTLKVVLEDPKAGVSNPASFTVSGLYTFGGDRPFFTEHRWIHSLRRVFRP